MVFGRHSFFRLGLLAILVVALAPAHADDGRVTMMGGVAFGGAPHLLSGHSSVSMLSEVIHMNVRNDVVDVDCQFVFHNAGPACTTRMGFPDVGLYTQNPDLDLDPGAKGPAKGTFYFYRSSVDGVKVPTQTVRAEKAGYVWHTKTVHFAVGQTRRVHDIYALSIGGRPASENASYAQTYYILHTAASWHGPIGRMEIIVHFDSANARTPLRIIPLSALNNDPQNINWAQVTPGTIVYRGPAKPLVSGPTLRFLTTNLRPTYNDDILLYFNFHTY